MPLFHIRLKKMLPVRILSADTFTSRLAGWLGRSAPEADELLHLIPCHGVHTWGMQFPIDVLFLDSGSRVIDSRSNLAPNRISVPKGKVASVIEAPAGFIEEEQITLGDRLTIIIDDQHWPRVSVWSHILHWPLNLALAILWAQLVLFIFSQGLDWFSLRGIGVLVHNSLLLLLFLFRRPSQDTSRRWSDWVAAVLTLACAMGLRPLHQVWEPGLFASLGLQAVGISGILFSLLSLGRSFGIIPANRQVQVCGAYRLVRHPLYASELLFYAGFLLGNPSLQNMILAGSILVGQVWRALAEEELLLHDPVYQEYAQTVRCRFIPGII
jgi:protein-S-isoprenylcysteine O-methyltransferase Ste14/uncharacterized membrane protein (UPF0127 family)